MFAANKRVAATIIDMLRNRTAKTVMNPQDMQSTKGPNQQRSSNHLEETKSKEEEPKQDDGTSESKNPSAKAPGTYAALRSHSMRFEEAIDPNAVRVDKLNKNDTISGRGKGSQNHPGNQRMREIVDKYKVQYFSLKRLEKRELVESVYKEIAEGDARFLKKVDGENLWIMVDVPVAMEKVSQALRSRKNAEKQPMPEPESGSKRSPGNVTVDPSRARMYTTTRNPALSMNVPAAPSSLGGLLGSSTFSILNNGRYGALVGGSRPFAPDALALSSSIDYYSQLRWEQLVCETRLLQVLQDSRMMESATMLARQVNQGASMPVIERPQSLAEQEACEGDNGENRDG
jgi:hypothetical protein